MDLRMRWGISEWGREMEKVSWSKFECYSERIAKGLIALEFEPQDKVAILSQNCPQWTCADVGALKAKERC